MKYYGVLLLLIGLSSFSFAQTAYTITPSTIVPEKPVVITFLLETTIKKIDNVNFEFSDYVSLGEYRVIPQRTGLFFTVTLTPHKAGTHALKRVIILSGDVSHAFDIGALFTAEGVVAIQGTWKTPQSVFQYEPFMIELIFPEPVSRNVYAVIGNMIRQYYDVVSIQDNKYFVVTSSHFKLPAFETEEDGYGKNVVLKILTEPLDVAVKEMPPGIALVAVRDGFAYSIKTQKQTYTAGERITIDAVLEGIGIPVNLQNILLTITGDNGWSETIPIEVNKYFSVQDSLVFSTITGSCTIILSGHGTYTIQTEPLSVFSIKTKKQNMLEADELAISVIQKNESLEKLAYLRNFLSVEKNQSWKILLAENDTNYQETLEQLKQKHFTWWSRDYAYRIAFAMIAGDCAYAQYQVLLAQHKGCSLFLRAHYPVYARLYYILPHPVYFFIMLVVFAVPMLYALFRKKRKGKQVSRLIITLSVLVCALVILMVIAFYERTHIYGITGDCPVYKVPDTEATTVALCKAGSAVKILTASQSWQYIEYEGKQGWIQTSRLRYTIP